MTATVNYLGIRDLYRNEVVPKLQEEFKYKSPMQIPRLEKVVINIGLGEAVSNSKVIQKAVEELKAITGQAPVVTRARKSISNFKLREGVKIGAMVTLRGDNMWIFLEKLFNIVLPRIRDFRGLSAKAFDGRGNYTMGLKEQIIFPEIDYDKVDQVRGMNISIVTTAKTDDEARLLLKSLRCPIQDK